MSEHADALDETIDDATSRPVLVGRERAEAKHEHVPVDVGLDGNAPTDHLAVRDERLHRELQLVHLLVGELRPAPDAADDEPERAPERFVGRHGERDPVHSRPEGSGRIGPASGKRHAINHRAAPD